MWAAARGLKVSAMHRTTPLHKECLSPSPGINPYWIIQGDAEQLVSLGTRINCRDKRGLTPLHYAASHGSDDIIELLLAKGTDVDAECQSGRMPIHYSAAAGQFKATKILLSKKAWSDSTDSQDDTPLHLAARKGDASVCQLLLDEGSSKCKEMRNKRGLTPLGEALVGNHLEAMEVLIDRGSNVEFEAHGFNLLHLACGLGLPDPLGAVFDPKRSKEKKAGSTLGVKLINSISSNKEAISPLHAAVMSVSVDCVDLLLKNGADSGSLNSLNQTPLDLLNWNAVKRGSSQDEDVEEIKSLLVTAMNKRPKNQAQKAKPQVPIPVKKEEPSAQSFESLVRLDQIKKVEALSNHPDISSLSHLQESARKALLEINRISKLLESIRAIAALRKDADYQKEVISNHVREAMLEIQQTNDLSKYRDDAAVLSVCSKLNKLQALLRSNGSSLPPNVSILQETLVTKEGPNSIEETNKRINTLESTREALIDRCIVAMGGRSKEDYEKDFSSAPSSRNANPDALGDQEHHREDKKDKEAGLPWLQRTGRDIIIQIALASIMAVFALIWVKFSAKTIDGSSPSTA